MDTQEEMSSYTSCQNVCSEGAFIIQQYRESINNSDTKLANNTRLRKVYRFISKLLSHSINPIKQTPVTRNILQSLPIKTQDLRLVQSVIEHIHSTLKNPEPIENQLLAMSIFEEIESFCQVQ